MLLFVTARGCLYPYNHPFPSSLQLQRPPSECPTKRMALKDNAYIKNALAPNIALSNPWLAECITSCPMVAALPLASLNTTTHCTKHGATSQLTTSTRLSRLPLVRLVYTNLVTQRPMSAATPSEPEAQWLCTSMAANLSPSERWADGNRTLFLCTSMSKSAPLPLGCLSRCQTQSPSGTSLVQT